jgi:hypothetical protein
MRAILINYAIPAVLFVASAGFPMAVAAQAAPQSASDTARNAAATWAGFGAAQQLFEAPGGDAPSATVTQDGAVITPADIGARMAPAAAKPTQAKDDRLHNAAPTVAVDAAGHGAVVSGASIR